MKKIIFALSCLLIAFVAHVLVSTGFFRNIENQFEGTIVKEIKLRGAEDITISVQDSFALISATNREIYPPTKEETGGLYYMDLRNDSYEPKLLTANFPKAFAPHGISMIKKDSTYRVMAINHTTKGHSMEVFELKGENLTHQKSLTDMAMIQPNDLVLINENRFYFTNDHGYTKGIGKFLEEYLGLALSNVCLLYTSDAADDW